MSDRDRLLGGQPQEITFNLPVKAHVHLHRIVPLRVETDQKIDRSLGGGTHFTCKTLTVFAEGQLRLTFQQTVPHGQAPPSGRLVFRGTFVRSVISAKVRSPQATYRERWACRGTPIEGSGGRKLTFIEQTVLLSALDAAPDLAPNLVGVEAIEELLNPELDPNERLALEAQFFDESKTEK